MTVKETDQYRVEVEIRVVNNQTGELVDHRGNVNLPGLKTEDFTPMKAVLKVSSSPKVRDSLTDLNKLFTVVRAISELT